MATKGKWQISKDFPTTKLNEVSARYRISSDEDNKKLIKITSKITEFFTTKVNADKFAERLKKEDILESIEVPHDFDTKEILFNGSWIVPRWKIVYFIRESLNPGCSIDFTGISIEVTSDNLDDKLKGTYELIK